MQWPHQCSITRPTGLAQGVCDWEVPASADLHGLTLLCLLFGHRRMANLGKQGSKPEQK